ncbi:hypothetical protein BXZ70DRAFT_252616 [Cristinia sonorae]|uniref:Nuclear rim protein 1 n=1 Tax=Cristinia sonorae TaxID=1940300 RepID=A0A8K0UYB3_9AGAR|nr:hypothetical protein BXZ70DRAFT_252616 [Cristinia sonorae]
MSLRRFAQTNSAAVSSSPRSPHSSAQASPSTPTKNGPPSTPRAQLVYSISPVTSPSLSASTPFDWEAARSRKPPPYASPLAGKRVRQLQNGSPTGTKSTPNKRVVRRKSMVEKIQSIPSQIAFEIALFPHNVPLPTPRNSAWLLGGFMHFLHLCVRVSQIRAVPDTDLGWEDMYRERESEPWFDWTVPMTFLLITASILNTLYLFSRTRLYQLNLATDPVASPHAAFVSRQSPTHQPAPSSPLFITLLKSFWRAFVVSVRFLLNLSPPKDRQTSANGAGHEKVQQLEMWMPGDLEMTLFAIYSPVHALLWMALTGANWMLMGIIMGVVGMQLQALTRSYEALIKDKAIIAKEVLHEYDEKFVYPRINPIRRDASVMTHQAEMVNVWDDLPRRHTRGVGI